MILILFIFFFYNVSARFQRPGPIGDPLLPALPDAPDACQE